MYQIGKMWWNFDFIRSSEQKK